jgi:hypothetical protein
VIAVGRAGHGAARSSISPATLGGAPVTPATVVSKPFLCDRFAEKKKKKKKFADRGGSYGTCAMLPLM